MKSLTDKKQGFTIIEFLIVIAIIGFLATMAIVATGYARKFAQVEKAGADLSEIAKGIETLALDTGQ